MEPIRGHADARFDALREAFARHFDPEDDTPELGGCVAVAIDGELVVDLQGGFADAARTKPWSRDTIVNVYSTTKGLVALCAHRLAEAGVLDLDAPVASLWPEFAAAGKADVPVHMLLSHRAGLPAIREKIPYEQRYDWDTITGVLAREAPWWSPGEKHGYHAVTYGYLVGEVIRRACGRSVGRYLREEIAEPAGLALHIGVDAALDAHCAELVVEANEGGEAKKDDGLGALTAERESISGLAFANPAIPRRENNARAFREAEIPAYNGHANAASLARLYSALGSGGRLGDVHLLGEDALARATTERSMGRDEVLKPLKTRFGEGFMLSFRGLPLGEGPRGFGHPGFGGSLAFCDPDRGLGFAYATNAVQDALLGSRRSFGLVGELYRALGVD